MDVDNHSQGMASFPSKQVAISLAIWLFPPVVGAALMSLSVFPSGITGIMIVLFIVILIPVSAFVLFRIDTSKNDGFVSVWGYR